jgi:zinc/manganese transport system substrate-binding protein
MMRLLLSILIVLAAPQAASAKLRIAATVPDLAAIAREVAGGRAEVISLTLPTQDPHFVDARPHLVLKLNRADLLLTVGLQLEVGWLPTLLTGARNGKIQKGSDGYLDCSTLVQLKEVPRQKIDRSMGDVHPGGNPHYLTNPQNAARIARALARRLGKLDDAGAKTYRKNADRFVKKLEEARGRWSKRLAPHRGKKVVAYHKSWIYFTDAMGLKIAAHLEPKPGIPPNAAHVLRVIRTMRREKVPVLLQEEYYPDRTARLVARKTGARLLILSGGTHLRRGESYIKRLETMVNRLVKALDGGKG